VHGKIHWSVTLEKTWIAQTSQTSRGPQLPTSGLEVSSYEQNNKGYIRHFQKEVWEMIICRIKIILCFVAKSKIEIRGVIIKVKNNFKTVQESNLYL
jgi:hypothetical protein